MLLISMNMSLPNRADVPVEKVKRRYFDARNTSYVWVRKSISLYDNIATTPDGGF
jgi:hypothetical protein